MTTIPGVDVALLEKEIIPTVEKAKALIISNKAEHGSALGYIKSIAVAEKFVKSVFAGPKAILDKAHKEMVADEKKWLGPIAEARAAVQLRILTYEDAERKKAEEEQRRLQAEARKIEEDRKLREAEAAEAAGDVDQADAILDEEITAPTVIVQPQISAAGGVSRPVYYRCKVENFLDLVKYVAANPHEIALLEPNSSALNARAKSMKEGFKLPGCSLDKEVGLSVRAL